MRTTGVVARGLTAPIFRQGDDLADNVCACVLNAARQEGFPIEDGDIIGITESVVARTQGNYASCEQIAADVRTKFGGGVVGAVFPILSRNRFSVVLRGIAMGCERLIVQLSYPADEVGNGLISLDQLDAAGVNPYSDSFDEAEFRALFPDTTHPFTGVDYIETYKRLGDNIEIVFSNNPAYLLKYTKNILCCDIHSRARTRRLAKAAGGLRVFALDEILSESVAGSGYNAKFGLLGSNLATADTVKLFPNGCDELVTQVQSRLRTVTGKEVEVLVYGDGCFKDPVGGIWEFADPVVAPAFTKRLSGTPNELKFKYFVDNELGGLTGEALTSAMRARIAEKDGSLVGNMAAQGTTPRRYTDLIGSLCDLVSGSGDRGTPIIYIKGYFTNYASE